jgi:hypothetical protein
MKTVIKLILLASCWLAVQNVFASAIGLKKSTIKLGVQTSAGFYEWADKQGATRRTSELTSPELVFSNWLSGNNRLWLELYNHQYAQVATQEHVGKFIDFWGVRLSNAKLIDSNDFFTPWLGAGLDARFYSESKRHTIDQDGYLAERFPDTRGQNVYVFGFMHKEWKLNTNLLWGLKAVYAVNPATKEQIQKLNIILLYNY